MTGFGASSDEEGGHEIRIEIRSVNHRHLQVKTRTPPELSSLENVLERQIKKRLVRGSVTLHLNAAHDRGGGPAAFDGETDRRYQRDIEDLAKDLGLEGGLSLDSLLALPGVVCPPDNRLEPTKSFERRLLRLLDQALDALIEMRAREGAALEADLRKHMAALDGIVGKVGRRMPTVVRSHQKQLARRVGELLDGRTQGVRSEDLAREIALLADRLDVSEELARLQSHLEQLGTLLDEGGSVGRRLDFLVQEVFREVNTIGSKCSDAKVAHWVVDAKTHAERLREQLANVE